MSITGVFKNTKLTRRDIMYEIGNCHRIFSAVSKPNNLGSVQCLKMPKNV